MYIYLFSPWVAQKMFHLNPDPRGFLGTRLYYLYVVHVPPRGLLGVKVIGSRESEVSEVTPVKTTSCLASTRVFKLETNQLVCPWAGVTLVAWVLTVIQWLPHHKLLFLFILSDAIKLKWHFKWEGKKMHTWPLSCYLMWKTVVYQRKEGGLPVHVVLGWISESHLHLCCTALYLFWRQRRMKFLEETF